MISFIFLFYFLSRKGFSAPYSSVKCWCAKSIYHSEITNGFDSLPVPEAITAPELRETAGREP